MVDHAAERRRRLTHRALPVVGGLALVALALGAAVGSVRESADERAARAFGRALESGDFRALHAALTPGSRARLGAGELRRAYEESGATATATRWRAGPLAGKRAGRHRLPMAVRTRVFGTVRGELLLSIRDGAVAWEPSLLFPGLRGRERLTRRTQPPARGRILSRDGKVLAQGPADARSSPLGEVAASIAGEVGPAEGAAARAAVHARGFPRDWPVGRTGLERAFENDVAGRPGGELIAGGRRVLARARARPSAPIRSTIDSRLQAAAVTALAGRFGGIAALDARTGQVRALAGVAFSAPQPPGSTFKIVTTTAALEARLVRPSTSFPVETRAVIDGVELENANGESCGGTFRNSFAHSCNSVFAPLGVRLGASRLVDAARRYGFNRPPAIEGARPSTLPPAAAIRTPLELGSTAIGQGKVLATPLLLASISQAVAAGGIRTEPSLRQDGERRRERVTSPRVAATLGRLMVDVVAFGTGTAAALPGVRVAGKTGTAELEDTRGPDAGGGGASSTDAWFTAYAPAERPRLAVAALFVRAGSGGETAAPAAKVVLEAAF